MPLRKRSDSGTVPRMRLLPALALTLAVPAVAQDAQEPPTPAAIVAAAPASDWRAIDPADLLVMTLAPDRDGNSRRVVIQLMPPPLSQGWVGNIRTLARAHWWDGTTVYRVVDNWVAQWGDGEDDKANAKPLPEGLRAPVAPYTVDLETLGEYTQTEPEALDPVQEARLAELVDRLFDPTLSEAEHVVLTERIERELGIAPTGEPSPRERLAMLSIDATQTRLTEQGWHDRDSYAPWVEFWNGWPIGNEDQIHWEDDGGNTVADPGLQRPSWPLEAPYRIVDQSMFWPVHCYGSVGVARDLSPDTGTGAELYAVIGHAPRALDRNIAVVGRVIEGIEHLSTLPRGRGDAGVYDKPELRVPIVSVRLGDELPEAEQPRFEYLEGESFARYVQVRANRNDPFYTVAAGGVDVCNVQVPIRRVAGG